MLHAPPPPEPSVRVDAEVLVPAGEFTMGTDTDPWALDNERPAHRVDLPAYVIDAAPVTNGQYAAFIADGGYDRPALVERGRLGAPGREAELSAADALAVATATAGRTGGSVGGRRSAPTSRWCTSCWYEAQAYAAWAGKRLPTEAEWEKAARWDPATGRSRRYPWGDDDPTAEHANLDQRHLRPAPVGAYPAGASPFGVHQLIGDVWEWTSTAFRRASGLRRVPLPRILGGLLRRRLPGAARWLVRHRPLRLPGHLPQLGLSDPPADLQRFPLRPGRATGRVVPVSRRTTGGPAAGRGR